MKRKYALAIASALPLPQSNSASDSMVVDRMVATSARIPWSVPVFTERCRGTVMACAGGPGCCRRTWLPFRRITE